MSTRLEVASDGWSFLGVFWSLQGQCTEVEKDKKFLGGLCPRFFHEGIFLSSMV
jgi:hypothetical protein